MGLNLGFGVTVIGTEIFEIRGVFWVDMGCCTGTFIWPTRVMFFGLTRVLGRRSVCVGPCAFCLYRPWSLQAFGGSGLSSLSLLD